MVNVLAHIVEDVPGITCVHSVSIMLSLATSLTRFAKNVSRSVAIAQAAALVVITHARGIGVTDLLHIIGATSVPRIGRVPGADVKRKLLRNHLVGRCATNVVKVKTRLSILFWNVPVWSTPFSDRKTKS